MTNIEKAADEYASDKFCRRWPAEISRCEIKVDFLAGDSHGYKRALEEVKNFLMNESRSYEMFCGWLDEQLEKEGE